ncbi:hypothetical protein MTR67_027238 [Solanum verrucosum]|uniref:Uncharacterized protein n=1 Tax=Solanum verrucosum TaxID=315347 RepID=A0AAF0R396_SOLVR|nr:hypothetical protein MTR67_027238 [Solanum verrucosum]
MGKVISAYAPRCFDDLLTSARTWSSAEYEYSSSRKMLYNCKNCPCQEVGEAAEYFTNQERRGCLISIVGSVVSALAQLSDRRSWFYSLEQGGFHVKLLVNLSFSICSLLSITVTVLRT